MKKLINILSLLLFIGVFSVNAQCCKNSGHKSEPTTKICNSDTLKISEVTAYYFHATRRCATCQAVEDVAKEAIKEYYDGKVEFQSINREKEKDNPLVKNHKIKWQTLLIVKGDKVVNLTNEAFMNARTNPEKFKNIIKSTIDSML